MIQTLLDNVNHGNIESLDQLRSDARFSHFLHEIVLIESTLESTHALWLLQRILDIFGDPRHYPQEPKKTRKIFRQH